MRFEVELEDEEAEPGGVVSGVARATEDERSRRVFARLFFMETVSSGGAGPHRVAELAEATLHEGDLASGQELRFELKLPDGALRTYSGSMSRLGWYVEIVSDEPGFDSRGEAEVRVVPEARASRRAGDLGTGLAVT